MKVIAVNGSPRNGGSTDILLGDFLEGARESGAETEQFRLYDLDFKGCRSCFACKVQNSPRYGYCGVNDGLKPIFDKIHDEADALVIGTPIYFGDVSGETRMFMERLLFQLLDYSVPSKRLLKKRIPVFMIFTMNQPAKNAVDFGYVNLAEGLKDSFDHLVGPCRYMMSYDNPVFFEYERYVTDSFDKRHKDNVRAAQFPLEREQARAAGNEIVGGEPLDMNTAAICGLFCGLCPAYPKECGGCLSDRVIPHCYECRAGFRACAGEKGYARCGECPDYYACDKLNSFDRDACPHHTGVVASVGRMRELGAEGWLAEQKRINTCPSCGAIMHWDRDDCQVCGKKKSEKE